MTIFGAILSGIFGLIIGSFLNVVMVRYNTGRSIQGRSYCFACNTQLRWYELIPFVSFIIQRGRCRTCGSRIPMQDFLTETITGALFALTFLHFSVQLTVTPWYIPAFLIGLVTVSLLVAITVYDTRHMIIPLSLSIPFVIITLIVALSPVLQAQSMIIISWPGWRDGLAGLFLATPFFLLWVLSKGRLLGFGDIILMLGMGWWLGLSAGVFALMLAFWIGTVVILGYVGVLWLVHTIGLVKKHPQRILSKEIPFAPFLIIATLLVYFTQSSLSTLLPYVTL